MIPAAALLIRAFARPIVTRALPMVLVGTTWTANIVLAYIRGKKSLKIKEEEETK